VRHAIISVASIDSVDVEKAIVQLPRGEKGAAVIESIGTARKILDSLEDVYKRLLKAEPDAVDGWHLRDPAERRTISDYTQAFQRLQSAFIITDDAGKPTEESRFTREDFLSCMTLWVGKLEEKWAQLAGEKLGRKDERAGKKFAALMDGLITISLDEPVLAPLSKKEKERRAKLKEIADVSV
jgi:hypothetical protein